MRELTVAAANRDQAPARCLERLYDFANLHCIRIGWVIQRRKTVLGITEDDAVALGGKYEQHAIVAGEMGEPARLVWCDFSDLEP
jgi:hypothetical protein